ncbi:MAG: lysophospholipid transporter LplT [Sulfuricellaceae bacterium]|jgi:LPLT family lysophospholipid transporter-like MFS transporter
MNRGFYIILAAQFFSALADNALLIAAIALLRDIHAPAQYEPQLKFYFTVSYVLLAAFVGAFADSMAKGRVMFISNGIKVGGCMLLLLSAFPGLAALGAPLYVYPLFAYAIVGLGAAAYSPAKYGILTELLPPKELVVANGWIEGLTVAAIILGTVMGGMLISDKVSHTLLSWDFPFIDLGINTPAEAAILIVSLLYAIAAVFNLYIPNTGVDHKPLKKNPLYLLKDFGHVLKLLWSDKLGQISLAVTTLFWGAGATLQFIVIKWAEKALHLPLSKASILQGIVAVGVALGSVVAAKKITIDRSIRVLPFGIALGVASMLLVGIPYLPAVQVPWVGISLHMLAAIVLMVVVGAMSGFFVVPMNALLQHRGHILMGAGHSIAVQNFNENTSILIMLGLYAMLIEVNVPVEAVVILFGAFVAALTYLVLRWHRANMREHGRELEHLLDIAAKSGHH